MAIFASTLLLIIPAGIPLLFLSQVDSTTGLVVLIGTSVCMLLLNAIVLVALMRWFRAMVQDG